MRRRATVTISAPEASSALSICSSERKPPVPAIRREVQARPPSSQPSAPPWIAARTSTLLPSASGVEAHSARGATSPSSATAKPRPASAPPAGPLRRGRALRRPRAAPRSARSSPGPPRAGELGGDRFARQWRQEDAVAVVAAGKDEAVERSRAYQRQVVGGAGAQSR